MLGRLNSNPNVLDQLFEATIPRQPFRGNHSEATFDLWKKGRPLKHPILNDRLSKATKGEWTLGVRMCE